MDAARIASPCSGVCIMDDASGFCLGCERTLEEISRWREMTATRRAAVMRSLAVRRHARIAAATVPVRAARSD